MPIKSNIKKPFYIPKADSGIPDSVRKETLFNGFKVTESLNRATKQIENKVVVKKGNRLDIILD